MARKFTSRQLEFLLIVFVGVSFLLYSLLTSLPPGKSPVSPPPPLQLISTYPPLQGDQVLYFNNEAVSFFFNTKISLDKAKISISPPITFIPTLGEKSTALHLVPSNGWKYDTEYTITVSQLTDQPITFKFLPREPDFSQPMGIGPEVPVTRSTPATP